MAGSAGLTRWLLLALVLAAHALALDWLARQRDPPTVLRAMTPAMYTRLLQPAPPPEAPVRAAPAPVAPARATRRATARAIPARPAASQPARVEAPAGDVAAATDAPAAPDEPAVLPAPGNPMDAAAVPVETAAPPAVAAAPLPAASATPPLADWPGDTRLSYRLGGRFRSGDLYGDARVQWQREGGRYEVKVDIDVTLWATLVMTSQGEVTADGLVPHAYEELRPGNRRRAARFGPETLALEHGKSAPRPPGMQDTASQFVELAYRFATGRETLEVGRSISFWMARPGAVDRWTYDVVEREVLQTPHLGAIETFRLKPRPIENPRGKVSAEMWFAPSLQYLPVRIKVTMGDEAHVDLLVDRIEQ